MNGEEKLIIQALKDVYYFVQIYPVVAVGVKGYLTNGVRSFNHAGIRSTHPFYTSAKIGISLLAV